MTASNIQITAGSGTRLATNSYSEGGVTVHDEKSIPGEYPYPTYTVQAQAVSGATAASHVMQLMAGSSLNVRVRRIMIHAIAAVAATVRFEVVRLTTAGTGGTSVTPGKLDNADGAAGATAMTLPTTKGTEGTVIWPILVGSAGATPQSAVNESGWVQLPNSKPIIIAAGTSNGIALKCSGTASTTYDVVIEFVETSF